MAAFSPRRQQPLCSVQDFSQKMVSDSYHFPAYANRFRAGGEKMKKRVAPPGHSVLRSKPPLGPQRVASYVESPADAISSSTVARRPEISSPPPGKRRRRGQERPSSREEVVSHSHQLSPNQKQLGFFQSLGGQLEILTLHNKRSLAGRLNTPCCARRSRAEGDTETWETLFNLDLLVANSQK